MLDFETVRDNIERSKALIEEASVKSGRQRDAVTLIGATKTQPAELIDFIAREALLTDVGENRVQEITAKYAAAPQLNWHMIGRLQSNKVKYIADKTCLIHSLDRLSLAEEIDRQAQKRGTAIDCLIEVNMGSEISKGGVAPDALEPFVEAIAASKGIRVRGLMCVMPAAEQTARLIALYRDFYRLFERLKRIAENPQAVDILSCGMSNDYRLAIAEGGATHVRLGRTLFGERN